MLTSPPVAARMACFVSAIAWLAMLTVSLGCSTLLAAESAESLLRRADNALYVAKREGRNRLAMAG